MEQKRISRSALKKVLKISAITLTLLILLITFISLKSVDKDNGTGIFGYKFFVVLSDSMKPEFQSGDVVIVKIVDPSSLIVGDTITFYTRYGAVVTHKIVDFTEQNGNKAFITQGINVGEPDENPVSINNVIGKYSFSVPKAGYFVNFLKTPLGYITFILVPLSILVILNGITLFKVYRRYKGEKLIEQNRRKTELENERKKNEQMNEEIKRLKEQLNNYGSNS